MGLSEESTHIKDRIFILEGIVSHSAIENLRQQMDSNIKRFKGVAIISQDDERPVMK